METLRRLLGEERADTIGRVVVSTIQTVYAENALRHDPEHGDDNLTFSVQVWRNSWFQLEQNLSGIPFLRVTRPSGSFQIDAAGFVIHVYKCGRSHEDVAATRFDKGQTRMSLTEANNLQLSIFDDTSDVPESEVFIQSLRHLVVAHCGTPEAGCNGIFVGAPVPHGVDGTQWWWLDPLEDGVPALLLANAESRAPSPVTLAPEPEILLRLRKEESSRVADAHDRE